MENGHHDLRLPLDSISQQPHDAPSNLNPDDIVLHDDSASMAAEESKDNEAKRRRPPSLEDHYAALDELRTLAHQDVRQLQRYFDFYRNYVNPRMAPTLFGATLEQLAATLRMDPDDSTCRAIFERFKRSNGVADMLELFAGLGVICDSTVDEKVSFIFELFDFANKGDLVEDEATMMLECVAGAFVKIGLVVRPTDDELEFCSGYIFTSKHDGSTKESITLDEFRKWATRDPASLEILTSLDCIPIVEGIMKKLQDRAEAMRLDLCGSSSNSIQKKHFATHFTFRHGVRVLTGPIVGEVTSSTAIVLIELSCDATVEIMVCISGGYGGEDVALAPSPPDPLASRPERSGRLRERLVRSQTETFQARVPRAVLLQGLSPSANYRVLLAGVAADDAEARIATFRTMRGYGGGALLHVDHFSHRSHLGSYEDVRTFGGRAIGPLCKGLSMSIVSTTCTSSSSTSSIGLLRAGSGEQSLWKTLWQTTVRPSRTDVMIHVGSHVDVSSAIDMAVTMLDRALAPTAPPRSTLFSKDPTMALHEMTPGEFSDYLREQLQKYILSDPNADTLSVCMRNSELMLTLESYITEMVRQEYRKFFNSVYVREVFASCPHLILAGAKELRLSPRASRSSFAPLFQRICRQVRLEYYDNLAPPAIAPDEDDGHDTGHAHCYGDVCILFIDALSNPAHEQFVRETLEGDVAKDATVLVLATNSPFTGRDISLSSRENKQREDIWAHHEDDFCSVLEEAEAWQQKSAGRKVVIVAGYNGIGAAGEANFGLDSGAQVDQITVGPTGGEILQNAVDGDPRMPHGLLPAARTVPARRSAGVSGSKECPRYPGAVSRCGIEGTMPSCEPFQGGSTMPILTVHFKIY